MDKKRLNYFDWVDEMDKPNYLVYIISGDGYWAKEFMTGLDKGYKTGYSIINSDISQNLKKARHRSLNRGKNLILFEPIMSISKKDLISLVEYMRSPSKNALFVVSLNDFKDKRKVLSQFKYLNKSKVIRYFNLDYPNQKFLNDYIKDLIDVYGIKFDCVGTRDFLVRRLIGSVGTDIRNEIMCLKELGVIIDKEIVKEFIEDNSSYTYDRLYETICKLDRKKIPYITYNDLLDAGKKDITIMYNVKKHLELLLQAKYLRMSGILIDNDVISKGKEINDKIGGLILNKENNIWDLNNYKINKLMRLSRDMSLKDILNCINIIDINVSILANVKDNKIQGYVDSEVLYKTFLELLNRLN